MYDEQGDFYDYYDDDEQDEGDLLYYSEEEELKDDDNNNNKNNYYEVIPTPRVEWEQVRVPPQKQQRRQGNDRPSTAYVLLPPSPPTMHPLPSAVLHFVGGTLFGSAPKEFYRRLLEDIVVHTQCAIVVTPLPPLAAPSFDHVALARTVRHSFRYAFAHVLEDEYGAEAMRSVPLAGLGHSLGARLLVVLATMMGQSQSQQSQQQSQSLQYKSMMLISFTNFGASAGIPGIAQVTKHRQRLDRKAKEQQEEERRQRRRRKMYDDENDYYDYAYGQPSRRSRRRRYNDDDDDDNLLEWGEIWSEMGQLVRAGADHLSTSWTPQAQALEFVPTPRQLWRRLGQDNNNHERQNCYRIPQTLLVQFDQDDMDQSAKLATLLMANNNNNATTTLDLKFARLRGTHLTPITLPHNTNHKQSHTDNDLEGEEQQDDRQGLFQKWSSKSFSAVWSALQGKVIGGGNSKENGMSQAEALLLLRQSITRYIADVVTK